MYAPASVLSLFIELQSSFLAFSKQVPILQQMYDGVVCLNAPSKYPTRLKCVPLSSNWWITEQGNTASDVEQIMEFRLYSSKKFRSRLAHVCARAHLHLLSRQTTKSFIIYFQYMIPQRCAHARPKREWGQHLPFKIPLIPTSWISSCFASHKVFYKAKTLTSPGQVKPFIFFLPPFWRLYKKFFLQ